MPTSTQVLTIPFPPGSRTTGFKTARSGDPTVPLKEETELHAGALQPKVVSVPKGFAFRSTVFNTALLIASLIVLGSLVVSIGMPDGHAKTIWSDMATLMASGFGALGLGFGANRVQKAGGWTAARPWWLMCASLVAWSVGDALWLVIEGIFGEPPFPSIADLFYMMYYPLMLLGVTRLPIFQETDVTRKRRFLVDISLVGIAGLLLFGSLIMAPIVAGASSIQPMQVMLSALYPALDMALLASLTNLLLARRPTADRTPSFILASGLLVMVLADCSFSYQALTSGYIGGELPDVLFSLAMVLAALAGFHRGAVPIVVREEGSPAEDTSESTSGWRRPAYHAAASLILLALAWVPSGHTGGRLLFLLLGSFTFVGLLLLRKVLVLRENERLIAELQAAGLELQRQGDDLAQANALLQQEIAERIRREEERRAMETRLQQTQKLESLGVLAGGIAHDFNNLLTGILCTASFAKSKVPADHSVVRLLGDIEKSSQKAAQLTQQMLAYSGRGHFRVATADLNQIVHGMESLIGASVSKNVELRYELSADPQFIDCDAEQLRQVIMNLITNGSEAIAPEHGYLCIRTGTLDATQAQLDSSVLPGALEAGRYVFFEVEDTGTGISPELLARIFEPFYSTKFTGRGLGLPATLGIVRGHGGTILTRSIPNVGTTFTVLLPPSPTMLEKARNNNGQLQRKPAHQTKILVVDDEQLVREVATRVLQSQGYQTLQAANGREALDIVCAPNAEVDVVLLDLTMPIMDGAEALREMHKRGINIPVVLASGYSASEIEKRFQLDTPNAFVQKPFTADSLIGIITAALA